MSSIHCFFLGHYINNRLYKYEHSVNYSSSQSTKNHAPFGLEALAVLFFGGYNREKEKEKEINYALLWT